VRSVKIENSEVEWLRLGDESEGDDAPNWMGEVLLGSFLYVRAAYRELFDIVAAIWKEQRWALLLGSPGQWRADGQPELGKWKRRTSAQIFTSVHFSFFSSLL